MLLRQNGYRKYYDNPEETIKNGRSRKATGYIFGEVYNGRQQKIMIVFEEGKTLCLIPISGSLQFPGKMIH